jgi:hypothetical protein
MAEAAETLDRRSCGPPGPDQIPPISHVIAAHLQTRTKAAHAMPSRAAEFRKRAAAALRNGRNARHACERDTHFDAAASYKALALEDGWLRGGRQRSIARKNK